ncbi:aldose 1-epimerase family protein [Mucilaginibacter limnophilus]|uniref:Aldose 1-epimerase family protein n=1 Tax=Mucilaginibacter limnophilus TaxID=1932778 RepID=A0A3S2UN10_9SPHI|nr:aldose 1-epimerase family protein [Mucilaginibacter limnophilus]RVU00031.1 aldose 1-epimerase family protein [Mucilaginibacter limnophilus]
MTVIENEYLRVTIRQQGAELTSIQNKTTGIEHLWQADASVWAWHAPTLFPVVGGLVNDELLVQGQAYKLPRHGFARNSTFILDENSRQQATFSLPYSNKTLEVYPYKFDFQIIYTLIDNALRVTYKVINLDDKTIYFSVGGHPAFNVPFHAGEQYEDYYLEFETEEPLVTNLLSSAGYFTGETAPVSLEGKKLRLSADLFSRDALVFKNIRSKLVTIKSDKHGESLSVEYPHFEHLGIWAKQGAPFLCIEPWLGYADAKGGNADISQKEAIHSLKHGHTFEAAYYISV